MQSNKNENTFRRGPDLAPLNANLACELLNLAKLLRQPPNAREKEPTIFEKNKTATATAPA